MRKVSLVFAGALMGATAMTAVGSLTSTGAVAASSETYRQLAIFGDIFERVRATYVTPRADTKPISTSEWPEGYLVAASITTSAPLSKAGWSRGVA